MATHVRKLSVGAAADASVRDVGRALLDAVLELAREQERRAFSLSVDRQYPARRLSERNTFRVAGVSDPTDGSVTMIAHL